MKYIIYVRVSTEEQRAGHSLQTQQDICLAHVPAGAEVQIILDSSSGGKDLERRVQLKKAINALDKGDILLVYKMDRLVRDYIQYGHLMYTIQAKKATVLAVMEKTQDRTMQGFTAIISDLERQRIKDNTRNALQARKRAGFRIGHIPYGYQLGENKKLVFQNSEQIILSRMKYLTSQGLSLRDLERNLDRDGITNRNGKPFSHVSIHKILQKCEGHLRAYSPDRGIHQDKLPYGEWHDKTYLHNQEIPESRHKTESLSCSLSTV